MNDVSKQPDTSEQKQSDIQKKARMSSHEIDELRERLYSRGSTFEPKRHSLADRQPTITQEQKPIPSYTPKETVEPKIVEQNMHEEVLYSDDMGRQGRRSKIRKFVAYSGVGFFVLAVSVSSFFLFWGNSTISGNNISIEVSGPISVGGGEDLNFQVSISNQNAVPIQSALLIVDYPRGTKSSVEKDKELILERIPLDMIDSGELVNIPLKAVVFGEEDEGQSINVRIEYRVAGSNATFERKANPLEYKVSTSPIVMTIEAVKQISSGQEFEMKLTVQSNSPTPVSNLLIKAQYPIGFDYTSSQPDTISGEDTWRITTLAPNEKQTITIKGQASGGENDVQTFDFVAGVAGERDANTMLSQLANTRTELIIEQPFLDVHVEVNGSTKESVTINERGQANVRIEFRNTLDTALYDARVEVTLGGNALNEFDINGSGGFYDSSTDILRWDGSSDPVLKEILPGRSATLQFTIAPKRDVGRTPEITLDVTFNGERRVFSSDTPQILTGIASRTIKVESIPEIEAEVLYSNGPFANTGPTPPVAEKVTLYTFELAVEAGVNDVTDAEMSAILPQYVSWLDLKQGDGDVNYNATTRTLKWTIGSIDSDSTKKTYVQISLKPSLSQVGSTPTLLGTQTLKATDRFTGTEIRISNPALTTRLYGEDIDDFENGKVQASE